MAPRMKFGIGAGGVLPEGPDPMTGVALISYVVPRHPGSSAIDTVNEPSGTYPGDIKGQDGDVPAPVTTNWENAVLPNSIVIRAMLSSLDRVGSTIFMRFRLVNPRGCSHKA